MDLSTDNLINQYKELLEYALQQLEIKTNECNSYKHKLGEIYHILGSDLIKIRQGVIKEKESGKC